MLTSRNLVLCAPPLSPRRKILLSPSPPCATAAAQLILDVVQICGGTPLGGG